MPGLYSRVNIEADGNILTAANYNAEHDNHITYATPQYHDDYSANASQMQATADPGEVGTESLATSLSGELERLRFAIKEIKGTSQWYPSPTTNLAALSDPSAGSSLALEFEGRLGGASSTTDVLSKFVNQGGIINALSLSAADVAAGHFDSTNKKFGSYSYALGAGRVLAINGKSGNPIKGSISAWYRNLSAGDYIAYNPLLGIELLLDSGGGRQTFKITQKTAATESTKTTTTVQGSIARSADTAFNHVSAKFKLNGEGGVGTDLLEMERNGVDEGTQLTAQTTLVSDSDGGFWFFGAKRTDPTWDHFYAANGLPTAHSSAWTSNGTPNGAVSNGILNIATTAANAGNYSKTSATLTGVNTSNMTFEIKCAVTIGAGVLSNAALTMPTAPFEIHVRDDSENRSFYITWYKDGINFGDAANTASVEIPMNVSQMHIYRVTASGSPNPTLTLYIDGIKVHSFTSSTADATANDTVVFGDTSTTSGYNVNANIEYVAFGGAATAPVSGSSTGNIDSVVITNTNITDLQIGNLQASTGTSVLGSVTPRGPTIPFKRNIRQTGSAATSLTTTSTTYTAIPATNIQYVAGDGVSQFYVHTYWTQFRTSAATSNMFFTIDVDGDFSGIAENANSNYSHQYTVLTGNNYTIGISRTIVLPPGLHTITPMLYTDTGTITFAGTTGIQTSILIARTEPLA